MLVKRENGVNAMMVYQGKANAVGKAQSLVFKLLEYRLCGGFNIFGNSKDSYMAFVHLAHKFNSRSVASSHLQEGIGFVQNIIRGVNKGVFLPKFCMYGFSLWIILVFRNAKGTEGAGVNEYLQSPASPYRYLS